MSEEAIWKLLLRNRNRMSEDLDGTVFTARDTPRQAPRELLKIASVRTFVLRCLEREGDNRKDTT